VPNLEAYLEGVQGVELKHHTLLISALDGPTCSASCRDHLTPSKTFTSTHQAGGCVGPRIGVDGLEDRRIS